MRYLLIPGVIVLMLLAFLSQSSESPQTFDRDEPRDSQGGGTPRELPDGTTYDEERPGDRVVYTEDGSGEAFADLAPRRVSIVTNEGNVVFASSDGDWPSDGYTWDIGNPNSPRLLGFRVVDGHFEPLQSRAELNTEYEFSWTGEGELVLTNPEGTWVVSRDGTELTIVSSSEGEDDRVRSSDGIDPVTLDDNLDVKSEDVGPIFGTRPSEQPGYFGVEPATWAWVGLGLALSLLGTGAFLVFKDGIGLVVLDIEERELNLTKKSPGGQIVIHAEQMELFTELRKDPDAARVIRYLFELIGSGAWGLPGIQETETPNEFYWRAKRTLTADQSNLLSRLADRYSIVRFAPEMTTLADRDAAIEDAQALYSSLHQIPADIAGP